MVRLGDVLSGVVLRCEVRLCLVESGLVWIQKFLWYGKGLVRLCSVKSGGVEYGLVRFGYKNFFGVAWFGLVWLSMVRSGLDIRISLVGRGMVR